MYPVTQALAVGPFLTPERLIDARRLGITHVFNVSGSDHRVPRDGFAGFVWEPLSDSHRIPAHQLPLLLTTLPAMATQPDAHVYVHCVAGHMRSPTVLWLYFAALGVPPAEAREWIETASPHAAAGHAKLVDGATLAYAQRYGAAYLRPVPRAEILTRV